MRRVLLVTVAALGLFVPASAHAQNPAEHYTLAPGPPVTEGSAGNNSQATFTVTRTGFFNQTTYVEYATDPSSTATQDGDFYADPGTVTFGPGVHTQTITVTVYADNAVEPDETLGVKLTDVTPSGNGSADHTVVYDTIVDDDGRPPGTHFDISDAPTVTEGGQSVFTVTLSNPPTAPMTVHYDTADGTANSGLDYSAVSNVLTFDAGETSKTVAVQTLADHEQDPNETFQLKLSGSSGPSIGQATATATIDDDITQSQKEHTVLGTLNYQPAFGIGFDGVEMLGPFAAPLPPARVTVTLSDGGGNVVAKQDLTKKDASGDQSGLGPIPYRLDGLGACAGCTISLSSPDGTVQDSVVLSFDGTPGQEDVDLFYASQNQGGSVDGTILAPLGAKAASFNVVIMDATGKVLADTKRVALGCGKAGAACPTAESYNYHLTGLPTDPIPVRAVLNMLTPEKATKFQVDSADFTLDPSGQTTAPDLTGISDPPNAVNGRTLYGQLNFLRPFAPGARAASDLDLESREQSKTTIEVRDGDGKTLQKVTKFTRTVAGYNGYEFHKLAACANCTVNVLDAKKVVATSKVVIPASSPSVTRRDLSYSKAGAAEFAAGSVRGGDTGARRVSVTITDAATGAKLSDSGEGDQACGAGGRTRCPDGGTLLYRLAGLPANRDVIVTLNLAGKPVDSRRLTTADVGQVTQVPLLVIPYGKGPRSIQGHVLNAGPFTLGDTAVHWKSTKLTIRLLDANQTEIARVQSRGATPDGSDRGDSFVLDNVQPCDDCTLELLRADGSVDDRVPVTVRGDSPSVTVADVGYGTLLGGAYVEGTIILRKAARLPANVKIQLLDATGKVLADSTKIPANRKSGAGASIAGTKFDYRLGGIPRTAGTLKLNVLQGKKKVASATVTLAPGLADAHVQDLKVDIKPQDASGR